MQPYLRVCMRAYIYGCDLPTCHLTASDRRPATFNDEHQMRPAACDSELGWDLLLATCHLPPVQGNDQCLKIIPFNDPTAKTAIATVTTNVAFDTQELLSDIRRVVEASLESALAHLPQLASSEPPSDERAEVDAILDDFAVNLMLSEEEEEDSPTNEFWRVN